MNKKYKLLILGSLAIILVVILSISTTIAFMKPIEQNGNLTSISLSSCAQIKLTSTSSVNISNSYPMSRNRGLQTTPYSFTVTSYCDSYVGFNMYIAILEDSTIDLKNVHYIITNKGSKNALQEGLLSDLEEETTFSNNEKTELRTGIKGNFSKIYKMFSGKVPLKGNREDDLYLFIDENATNDAMGKVLKAGVAIKSYEREIGVGVDEVCANGDNLNSCVTILSDLFGADETLVYHHDGTLENGIDDGSYRYAGASDKVNNFVCFGSDEEVCPNNNLYRIIGVIDSKIKLIKYDYATKEELGEDGAYVGLMDITENYKGDQTELIASYYWDREIYQKENTSWETSYLNTINLNKNFLSTFTEKWQNLINVTNWNIGAGNNSEDYSAKASVVYQNELKNPKIVKTISKKIALSYVTDYGLAAWPWAWKYKVVLYSSKDIYPKNWMYLGMSEWHLTLYIHTESGNLLANFISSSGYLSGEYPNQAKTIRPVFFLVENSLYKSGNGTKDNPLRIN